MGVLIYLGLLQGGRGTGLAHKRGKALATGSRNPYVITLRYKRTVEITRVKSLGWLQKP